MTDKEQAIEELRAMLEPGDVVYTILRNVNREGTARSIDLYKFGHLESDGRVHKHWLSRRVALACGYRWDGKRDAVRVSGGGMDMGLALVYDLSRTLFEGDGYALKHEWL